MRTTPGTALLPFLRGQFRAPWAPGCRKLRQLGDSTMGVGPGARARLLGCWGAPHPFPSRSIYDSKVTSDLAGGDEKFLLGAGDSRGRLRSLRVLS